MHKDEVPQDDAGLLDGVHELTYAVDGQGRYTAAPSPGWEPSNLANAQYWQLLDDEVRAAIALVRAGAASPLAYWMSLHQMDDAMVAAYVGLRKSRVRRHRHVVAFAATTLAERQRYAAVFKISVEQLSTLPAEPQLATQRRDEEVKARHAHD